MGCPGAPPAHVAQPAYTPMLGVEISMPGM